MRSTTARHPSRFHRDSLKFTLLLPYVLLIGALTVSIGAVTYWAGGRTVSSLTERLMHEMVERMQQAVVHHVSGSSAVLEAAFPEGMPASARLQEDWPLLRERLWAASALHPQTNRYVYYGNRTGQGAGLYRLDAQNAQLRLKFDARSYRRYYHLHGIHGTPTYQHTERSLFDPRQRPWYRLAQSVPHSTWTAVYIDFSAQDLVVTRARRVSDAQGQLQGVVGTDVSLLALNQFVDHLATGLHGRAMLFEPRGELIAISGMHNVRKREDGHMERVTAHNLGDPVVLAVYEHVLPWFRQWGPPAQAGLVHDAQGEPVHVAFRRITDSAGLDWMAVVAIPRQAILADVSRITGQVIWIGLLAMLTALCIGWHIFGRVADDVGALSEAVRRMQQGAVDTPLPAVRSDELGELTRSFVDMRQALFTDPLTGVANRHALLQTLHQRTQSHAAPFALLFIDLNHFTPLNDRWGHDNGDRALAEVAQRIQNALPPGSLIARLGGDEFVVLLDTPVQERDWPIEAQHWRTQLTTLIETPLQTLQGVPAGEVVTLGAAIGTACYPRDAEDVETLLRHADQAMYADKHPSNGV